MVSLHDLVQIWDKIAFSFGMMITDFNPFILQIEIWKFEKLLLQLLLTLVNSSIGEKWLTEPFFLQKSLKIPSNLKHIWPLPTSLVRSKYAAAIWCYIFATTNIYKYVCICSSNWCWMPFMTHIRCIIHFEVPRLYVQIKSKLWPARALERTTAKWAKQNDTPNESEQKIPKIDTNILWDFMSIIK